jgi:hypothetical protein
VLIDVELHRSGADHDSREWRPDKTARPPKRRQRLPLWRHGRRRVFRVPAKSTTWHKASASAACWPPIVLAVRAIAAYLLGGEAKSREAARGWSYPMRAAAATTAARLRPRRSTNGREGHVIAGTSDPVGQRVGEYAVFRDEGQKRGAAPLR